MTDRRFTAVGVAVLSLDRLMVRWNWAEKRSDVVATIAAAMASTGGTMLGR